MIAGGSVHDVAFVTKVHNRQSKLLEPRLDDRAVAHDYDREALGVDVLSRDPAHVFERHGFEALDLAREIVVRQSVVNQVHEPPEDLARRLETGWIAADQPEARLLELGLGDG